MQQVLQWWSQMPLRHTATYGVRVLLQWYCQIPGSRLWDEAARNGLVTEAMYDEFGFFSNYYLFQSGVKIPTADIYAISDKVAAVRTVSQAVYKGRNMIEYAFPEPVAKYFPRILETFQQNGLASLRQVAGPGSQAARREIPVEPPTPLMKVINRVDAKVGHTRERPAADTRHVVRRRGLTAVD